MKSFPKINKKLKSFLTSESNKITKKNALLLGAGIAMLSSVVNAGSFTNISFPNSTNIDNDTSGLTLSDLSPLKVGIDLIKCSHGSGITNGHFSSFSNLNSISGSVKISSGSVTPISGGLTYSVGTKGDKLIFDSARCNDPALSPPGHMSALVNGHYSSTPTLVFSTPLSGSTVGPSTGTF